MFDGNGHVTGRASYSRLDFWLSTTPIVGEFRDLRYQSDLGLSLVQRELQCRALRVVLAAHVWRLEHGQWPDSLDQLQGTVLDCAAHRPLHGRVVCLLSQGCAQHHTGFRHDTCHHRTRYAADLVARLGLGAARVARRGLGRRAAKLRVSVDRTGWMVDPPLRPRGDCSRRSFPLISPP